MYSSQSISQTDRETISYSNPIYSNLTIPQTIIGLPEYQSQSKKLGYILSKYKIIKKNQIDTSSSDNNGYIPNSIGSNFSSSKTKKNPYNIRNALKLDWSNIKNPVLLHSPIPLTENFKKKKR
jgi:hypothetical protein